MPEEGKISHQGDVSQSIIRSVDIVFVVDITGSNRSHLMICDKAPEIVGAIRRALAERTNTSGIVRMRMIGFRDFYYDASPWPPIEQCDFFTVIGHSDPAQDEQELQKFRSFAGNLQKNGGEDEPESGLEALHLAIQSDWNTDTNASRFRRIIILFTDAEPHPLDDYRRDNPFQNPGNGYPEDCPQNLGELYDEYSRLESEDCIHIQKRLFLIAPKGGIWEMMGDCWDNTLHLEYRKFIKEGLPESFWEGLIW